jgi:hypothetical protein
MLEAPLARTQERTQMIREMMNLDHDPERAGGPMRAPVYPAWGAAGRQGVGHGRLHYTSTQLASANTACCSDSDAVLLVATSGDWDQ